MGWTTSDHAAIREKEREVGTQLAEGGVGVRLFDTQEKQARRDEVTADSVGVWVASDQSRVQCAWPFEYF